jgi:exosortase
MISERGRKLLITAIAVFIFIIPEPDAYLAKVTEPYSQWLSSIVVGLVSWLRYPISRFEAVLAIGAYQMLVADACAVVSMFSLTAVGLLFMFARRRKSLLHNAIMLAGILPIAFAANVVRVVLLVVISYHFGDEAGQAYFHDL